MQDRIQDFPGTFEYLQKLPATLPAPPIYRHSSEVHT
jgi:hypothetical protein